MRFRNSLSLLLPILLFFSPDSFAQASITAVYFPSSVASGGGAGTVGWPYAVYVKIQNWASATGSQAYVKIYNGSNNEYMWSSTGVWSNSTTYASANQPVVAIDAGGNWSGWIYAKHNDNVLTATKVRAAKVGSTSTNLTNPQSITVLDMSTGGGWIVRPSSPAVNKGILAYSGGSIVGTYRTEDNGIVEGYSYGVGGFKIAVPVGFIDSLVSINDDGSRDQAFPGPWFVTAGQETDASTGGGVVGKGTASILPSVLGGGIPKTLTLTLHGADSVILTNTKIVVPSAWSWSHSTADLSVTGGGTPSTSVAGDTVIVSALSLPGTDSVHVQFTALPPPDSTATFAFPTLTGTSPDSIFLISTQPSVFVYSIPRPISDVRQNDVNGVPLANNTLVTVRGIVTVANEFGSPSYVQDNSGGLAVYGSAFSTTVHAGDEVIVSGLLQPFYGLLEIVNTVLDAVVSTGNSVSPLVVNAAEIAVDGPGGVEQYEGLLVRLNAVDVGGATSWAGETNYPLGDASGTTELRIDGSTNLVGQPVPASQFDLVGVVGQRVAASPFIGGYQIMPRSTADVFASGPMFATSPVENDITPTALTISWTTIDSGTTHLRYGKTPAFELGVAGNDTLSRTHRLFLTGLDPSTVYYIAAFSARSTDTSFAGTLIASTASPAPCTGAINVYFNKSVNTAVSWSGPANGNWDLISQIVGRIDNAHRSVDAALYSLSGSSQGDVIAQALARAWNRGVKVRVIGEHDNRNTTAFENLAGAGIPLIDDAFDAVTAGTGLMHNKFFVIDGRGGAPDSAWVSTGSWNPTQPGTLDDYQNSVEIQDQALAGAYTLEFNEMWGSATDVSSASSSRFGSRKTDNTPHRFVIGGRAVESYFSPSDRTTSHLVSTLAAAQHSVGFAILTFTRVDLADAVVGRKDAGVAVRGLMDNNTDTGNEYSYLLGKSIDLHLKTGSGLLHHKYAVLDAERADWNGVVITGSHNWSSSAETSNNENTLIIRDGAVANQYLQEFAARYYQFGGTDSITLGVNDTRRMPLTYGIDQNYPNPFNQSTTIGYQLPAAGWVTVKVYDVLGRSVVTLVDGPATAGSHNVRWNASGLASGVYLYKIEARVTNGGGRAGFVQVRKMMLLK